MVAAAADDPDGDASNAAVVGKLESAPGDALGDVPKPAVGDVVGNELGGGESEAAPDGNADADPDADPDADADADATAMPSSGATDVTGGDGEDTAPSVSWLVTTREDPIVTP